MNIQEKSSNIKSLLAGSEFFTVALIVVVAVVSFGLGKMSVQPDVQQTAMSQDRPIYSDQVGHVKEGTEKPDEVGSVAIEGGYVASVKGTKYHLPWCTGAQQMKEENKIYRGFQELSM